MMFTRKFIKKANQFRKQNWSAPTIMSAFIAVCMILVYSFESIGLLNKEKNLDFRITTPEKIIKTAGEIKVQGKIHESNKPSDELSEKVLIDKLKMISEKSREENFEQMMKILIEGANDQLRYQNHEGSNTFENREVDFYDI